MSLTAVFRLLLLLAAAGQHSASASSLIPLPSERRTLSLDGAWTMTFNGATWTVAVPGNIPYTFGESIWRRTFALNLSQRPAAAFLDFDGVVNHGRAKLNGTDLGPLYAFTATRFDVAPFLRLDGQNELLVTLDDRLTETTVPGGLTTQYLPAVGAPAYTLPVAWANRPGIIRSVRLTYSPSAVLGDVRVQQKFGPSLDYVDLDIRASIAGRLPPGARANVQIRLNNSVVGNCSASVSAFGAFQCQHRLNQPRLWSPDSPNLYEFVFELTSSSGALLDSGYDRIGIRKFEARGARFFLNNQPVFLRGITRHDIYGERGFVADELSVRQDLALIKSLGANFVRCIHYPHNEIVLRVADEIGLLLSEELPAWARLSEQSVVHAASSMLSSLMQRDFNRASVVMYFVASVSVDRGESYLKTLIPLASATDPSRLVSLVFDDFNTAAGVIAGNVDYSRRMGAHFHAQNTYWPPALFDSVMPAIPPAFPFLSTEWTGSEGSDRGPLGSGPTVSFPSHRDEGSGVPEGVQSEKMIDSFRAFFPYVCSDTRTERCLAGAIYFNYQDVEWPGMPFFYPNHHPFVRTGLVYEDRAMKIWPSILFRHLMWMLPR